MCRSEERRRLYRASLAVGAALVITSCATTTPPRQQYRSFFLPPSSATKLEPQAPLADAPKLPGAPPSFDLYAFEKPTSPLPPLPRPADGEFLIRQADEHFALGKRAFQEGRTADSRREFNRAIEILLSAPDNLDRTQIDRRLEDLTDSIYRYDLDQQNGENSNDKVSYEKRPIDEILESTFPVEPSLRSRVKEQIQATASQLPLEESDAVISFINFFSSERGKRIISAGLHYSGRYKPMIERILAEEGVPQELIFLAQAESGFQPRAMSNKLCVGLWQFAKFRGNEYGLKQTPYTDDRMDPEMATRAAAKHLHDLYTHFGDWYLAMAAYDCGPQCIDHAVARTGYADFWTLRRMGVLPQETANYVPAILAMTIIAKNARDYGLQNVEFAAPMSYETVQISSPTHLALVAAALDRPVSEIKELNPAILRTLAPAGYSLHIPVGTTRQLETAFNVVPAGHRDSWRVHRIEPGDNFASIAKRYGTTTALISGANQDQLPGVGGWVAVPVSYPGDRIAAAKPVAKTAVKAPAKTATHPGTAQAPPTSKAAAQKPPVHPPAQTPAAQKAAPKAPPKSVPANAAANRATVAAKPTTVAHVVSHPAAPHKNVARTSPHRAAGA